MSIPHSTKQRACSCVEIKHVLRVHVYRPGNGQRSCWHRPPAARQVPHRGPCPNRATSRGSRFRRIRCGLISLGGPRIDEAAVVEAVDDEACGVAQHHAARARRERRAAEPLVGRRRALVARGRRRGVAHDASIAVLAGERRVERDALPSACTGSLLEWANAVAGVKLIPVPCR